MITLCMMKAVVSDAKIKIERKGCKNYYTYKDENTEKR